MRIRFRVFTQLCHFPNEGCQFQLQLSQPFLQILMPIIKRRKQQKTWKIWISNQPLGKLIFCRVGVLSGPNLSNRFHLSSSMVLRKSSRNAFFCKSATLPLAHLTIWWLKLFLNWKCIRIYIYPWAELINLRMNDPYKSDSQAHFCI